MSDFDKAILSLAAAQKEVADLNKKYGTYLVMVDTAKANARNLEKGLREEAILYFRETGDKQIHEAIEVKLVKRKDFKTAENVTRALENNPNALCVDPVAFKAAAGRVASAIIGFESGDELDLVVAATLVHAFRSVLAVDEKVAKDEPWAVPEITEEPTVFLASKLGHYLIFDEPESKNSDNEGLFL